GIELFDDVVAIQRRRDGGPEKRADEFGVLLDFKGDPLEPVVDERHARYVLRAGQGSPNSLPRRRLMSSRSVAAFSKSRLAAAARIFSCRPAMWASSSACL